MHHTFDFELSFNKPKSGKIFDIEHLLFNELELKKIPKIKQTKILRKFNMNGISMEDISMNIYYFR